MNHLRLRLGSPVETRNVKRANTNFVLCSCTSVTETEIKIKDIQDYIKNQEVSQINTTVNKTYQYKITAPPRTFQIDIFWWKRGETLIPILLLVDVLSRKAWAYVLTKSKMEKRRSLSKNFRRF